MDPYTASHFRNVARNLNTYVTASAYNFQPGRDSIPMGFYQPTFYPNVSLGDRFANGLYSIGLPDSIVNFGYRVGDLINGGL